MLINALVFLLQTLASLFMLVVLLRFYLQVARAPFQHPLVQFVVALTNFAVIPLRRVIPSVRGYDSATLLLAWLVSFMLTVLLFFIGPMPYNFASPQAWLMFVLLAILGVFRISLHLLMGAVIVQAVLSWVSPYNPLRPILSLITEPFLKPFHRFTVANVDLAPLVLLILVQLVLAVPMMWLELTLSGQVPLSM